jgi:hypothetical protein
MTTSEGLSLPMIVGQPPLFGTIFTHVRMRVLYRLSATVRKEVGKKVSRLSSLCSHLSTRSSRLGGMLSWDTCHSLMLRETLASSLVHMGQHAAS